MGPGVRGSANGSEHESPVLIAYDGSGFSKFAIEEAGRHLRTPRRALVLTVWTKVEALPFWGPAMVGLPAEVFVNARADASKTAAEGVNLARSAGFAAEPLVESGAQVWKQIVDSAAELEAGLIVLGSQGRSAVSYALMGSVATAVAHHADQPVLITRSRDD